MSNNLSWPPSGSGASQTDVLGLPISRTNHSRMSTARRVAGWGWRVVVSVCAVLGVFSFFRSPPVIDVDSATQRTNNAHDQIGGFAGDCMELVLTARETDAEALGTCFDTKAAGEWSPGKTTIVATAVARDASIVFQEQRGDVSLYMATVTVMQRELPTSAPSRKYYRMPVTVWNQQTRIIGWPEAVNGPGPGVHVKLGYRITVPAGTPLYTLVTNFVSTYLTQTTGLNQWVLADAKIYPVGGYTSGQLLSLKVTAVPGEKPVPGKKIRALAQVLAKTAQNVPMPMTMPLTLQNNNGTWMVSALDLAPQLSDEDPEPITAAAKPPVAPGK
ncbi:conjugal transfer protein [Mycobacteroides abscessus]|uniref:conjugal transfer protein n=1 Tax=Mycobacteroides abscessus TaxID=36809 RepID=UPI0009A747F2|nr:conjugal transfer protein [Mycobacteroides abscessus]SKK27492.1 Conjugative transposon protein TcpC [Mycobacteroides abscessus subsp. massiliense]SKK31099.1 Conjugative transposon protein TcpC [Mycobacteroides abscessus subsp. massiliense]SKK52059.1 Conjugative transposon protein TcpC [Mycobacteroides abscessus subsp. massiliense]